MVSGRVELSWLSPECRDFSQKSPNRDFGRFSTKAGTPVLAGTVTRHKAAKKPPVIKPKKFSIGVFGGFGATDQAKPKSGLPSLASKPPILAYARTGVSLGPKGLGLG